MQIDDLRYFTNAAAAGSFARGAALSCISPPAMSKAVRRLEEHFGAELFVRTTRRVALTESGEILLARCRRIFDEFDALRLELSASRTEVSGELRVGAMEVFSIHVLPRAIADLVGEYPQLCPRTYEMIPQRMEDLLLMGRLDVAFTTGGGSAPGLVYRSLGRSQGVLVCGREHPLHVRGRISAEQLTEYPSVVPKFLGLEHLPVIDQFPDDIYPRAVGATIELLQMGVQLVLSGRFLGFFPEVSIREHLESGALKALHGVPTNVAFELSAITRERGVDKLAIRLLIEGVRARLDG